MALTLLALAAAAFGFACTLDGFRELAWFVRWQERRAARRVSLAAEAERLRWCKLYGDEIRLWDAFHEAAKRAFRYPVEAWYRRIPEGPAWDLFLRALPAAVVAAGNLPEPHRSDAMSCVQRIEAAIRARVRLVLDPDENELTRAVFELQGWTSDMRRHHFLPLYRRCGSGNVPHPPDLVKWPTAEDFVDLPPGEIPPRLR